MATRDPNITTWRERRIEAIAWAAFLAWLGLSVLAAVGWGWGLLGVGVITLGAQVARRRANVGEEPFWVWAGTLFAVVGLWSLASPSLSVVPALALVIGVALMTVNLIRRHRATG